MLRTVTDVTAGLCRNGKVVQKGDYSALFELFAPFESFESFESFVIS